MQIYTNYSNRAFSYFWGDLIYNRSRETTWYNSYFAMAEGAISSRFSILHSSKNSRIGLGWEPTLMYAINAKFFTNPTA